MTVRDNVRRYCLLSVAGLSLALVPAALFAQTPATPLGNPGSALPPESTTSIALIAAIAALVGAIAAPIANVFIALINKPGEARRGVISGKLLSEQETNNFRLLREAMQDKGLVAKLAEQPPAEQGRTISLLVEVIKTLANTHH